MDGYLIITINTETYGIDWSRRLQDCSMKSKPCSRWWKPEGGHRIILRCWKLRLPTFNFKMFLGKTDPRTDLSCNGRPPTLTPRFHHCLPRSGKLSLLASKFQSVSSEDPYTLRNTPDLPKTVDKDPTPHLPQDSSIGFLRYWTLMCLWTILTN